MTTLIEPLFELLDDWRHLPNYQLERRADIFFGLYLPEFLEDRFEVVVDGWVPEFPIKRDLIWPEVRTNQSVKVDYVAFGENRAQCLFVELKTDGGSRREAQDHYLERSRQVGMGAVVEGLKSIVQASSAHKKYFHLLSKLEEVGCVNLPEELGEYVFPQTRPGLRRIQDEIEVCVEPDEFEVDIVYVQPVAKEENSEQVVGFEEFAQWLDGRDKLARVFAAYLRRWTTPAGMSRRGK